MTCWPTCAVAAMPVMRSIASEPTLNVKAHADSQTFETLRARRLLTGYLDHR